MSYEIDVNKWKKIALKHAIAINGHENPCDGQTVLVFNLSHPFDDFYGEGPTNMAFARYDKSTNKFMSTSNPGEPISYGDFYDFCNHNIGGHDGKITHWIDDWELSRMLTDLLISLHKHENKK